MDVNYQALDGAVSDIARYFERATKFPFSQLTLTEMYYVDRKQASAFELRVRHFVENHNSKQDLLRDVNLRSKYKSVLGPLVNHYAKVGKPPRIQAFNLPSSDDISKKYRTLTPLMLSKVLNTKISLLVAKSVSNSTMWFATSDISTKQFDCIGYKGESKTIAFSSLDKMGYKIIQASQPELRSMCMKEVQGQFQNREVRALGLYLGKEVKPHVEARAFDSKINEFLSMFPDPRRNRNVPASEPRGLR